MSKMAATWLMSRQTLPDKLGLRRELGLSRLATVGGACAKTRTRTGTRRRRRRRRGGEEEDEEEAEEEDEEEEEEEEYIGDKDTDTRPRKWHGQGRRTSTRSLCGQQGLVLGSLPATYFLYVVVGGRKFSVPYPDF